MKRGIFILLIIIFSIFLTSCSVPGQQKAPDMNAVATRVQQTLDARPTATPAPTDAPTATELPAQPTTASPPTEAPTSTPEVIILSTITPTATLENPKQNLGSPAYRDELNTGSNFGVQGAGYKDDQMQFYVENSAMVMKSFSTNGYRGWRLTYPRPTSYYLEAPFQTTFCANGDLYGLNFHSPDYSNGYGYYYGITCDGNFSLTKNDNTGTYTLINSTFSDKIRAGSGQTNLMGVSVKGQTIKLYINDSFIQEVTDSKLSGEGHFGVFVSGRSGALTVTMSDIQYWNIY